MTHCSWSLEVEFGNLLVILGEGGDSTCDFVNLKKKTCLYLKATCIVGAARLL